MRAFIRPAVAALIMAGAASLTIPVPPALAHANERAGPAAAAVAQAPEVKQIALTDKQIDGVLASQKEMDAITEKLPENAQPDAKVIAQLDGVAKKHGFASYDEYNTVV